MSGLAAYRAADRAARIARREREDLYAAVAVAWADRGWSVPTGIESAPLALLRECLAIALPA